MIQALYAAADHAGLLKEAVWSPSDGSTPLSAKVDFRAPNETVLDVLGLSTDYSIRYPASAFTGLVSGESLIVEGATYRVREIRALGDGSEKQATLTRP